MKIIYKSTLSLLTILILLLVSCRTSKSLASHRKMYKKIYVDQFKLTYVRKLLIKSYNNTNDIQNIINLDRSGFTEAILTMDDYRLIDSLTKVDNNKLTIDSTNSIGQVAEGAEGKHILGYVIAKIQSKWLDSLAKKRYKYAKVGERFPE